MTIVSFQIVDIASDDWTHEKVEYFKDKQGDPKIDKKGNEEKRIHKHKQFIITLYGINHENQRLVCHVTGFYPYFFVKIPDHWTYPDAKNFIADCSNGKTIEYKSIELKNYKDFYGLYWNHKTENIQLFKFLKISFKSHYDMKQLTNKIKEFYHKQSDKIKSKSSRERHKQWKCEKTVRTTISCDCNLYESTIHPIIKFIHDSKIDPTGWIEITHLDKSEYKTKLFQSCINHEYSCAIKSIRKLDIAQSSRYKIASFDIECDSLTGDFPLAQKDFKKLSSEIFDSFQSILKNTPESRRQSIQDNIQCHLKKLITAGFKPIKTNSFYKWIDINRIYTKSDLSCIDNTIENIVYKIENDEPDQKRNHILDDIKNLSVKTKERNTSISEIEKIIQDECQDSNINNEGDPIIQIGTVFYEYGTGKKFNHILVLGNKDNLDDKEICDDIEGVHVERCKTEQDLLMGWQKIIKEQDPDFITGYNIFGFDFKYIIDRAKVLFPCKPKCRHPWSHDKNCEFKKFMNFGKMDSTLYRAFDHRNKKCCDKSQQLSSSALGDNTLDYIFMDGRILFDIQKEVQKGHNLESYKLDNVASHFMRGKIKEINEKQLIVSDTGHLKAGDYISFRTHNNIGEELFQDGKKFKIHSIENKTIELHENLFIDLLLFHKVEWCLNKDDISPQDIFDKHKKEGPSGRAEVAKYCIQDCELCINLLMLLDIIPNNLGMANVSYVPASYIFLRGQGVKVTSVVSKTCSERNTKIPDLKKLPPLKDYLKMIKNGNKTEDDVKKLSERMIEDYEKNKGEFKKYLDSSMEIANSMTDKYIILKMIDDADWRKPEEWELDEWFKRAKIQSEDGIEGYEGAIVLDPKPGIYLDDPIAVLDYASLYPSSIIEKNLSHETYIEDKSLLSVIGEENYYTIKFQDWIYKNVGKGDTIEKIDAGTETECHFLKPEYMKKKEMFQEGEKQMGIIPAVLDHLLSARKATKKRMGKETDEFKKKVLDGLQLAYKVTANSVYGQLGAKTSTIFKMNLAACTTSVGRSRIDDASDGVKEWAKKKRYKEPEVIYGDTDSVFVKFSREVDGKILTGKEALKHCIQCGKEAGDYITKGELIDDDNESIIEHKPLLNHPQDLEYEKTFWPFILISKKRYTGDKYEFDIHDCKRTSMGIVLKRRDNAHIVKYIFGNVIEKIMIEKDFKLAVQWLTENIQMIRNQEFNLRYFVITKALRGYYKNPQQIAHKVLADRIAIRDPGNKPKANDRIPYAYIKKNETPEITGYKKKTERREIGTFKNGKPKFKNFRVDDLSNPIYKKEIILQGDRIEHIDYIQENDLEIDYEFYITNQIMNPVKQVLDLEMDSNETIKLFQ